MGYIIDKISLGGDTYTNRYTKKGQSQHPGNKKYKAIPQKCAKCGSTKNIDIDHKDGNRDNNSPSNLRPLCRSCHRSMHDGKGAVIISTAARIIDDPKTQESEAIAKNKNSDLVHVEFILCHADINANQDEFLSDDLGDSYATAVNKPINWGHTNKNIGVIYESKYVSIDNLAEGDREYYQDIDELKKDFVVCRAAIWSYKHPEEAKVMQKRQSEKKLYFSMENHFGTATCSECKETFNSGFEYCDHLLFRRQTKTASRQFGDSNFIGAAVVVNPADSGAKTLAIANEQLSPIFYNLVKAKSLSGLDINKDLIPYLLWREGVEMRQITMPQEVLTEFSGEHTTFADDINKVFPVDSAETVEKSAKYLLNNELPFYDNEEKLYIFEKVSLAAKEFDIDITEYIIEGDNEPMTIDRTSKEFTDAVAQAVQERLSELESTSKLTETQTQLAEATKNIEKISADLKTAQDAKADVDKKFTEYKEEIAKAERVAKRLEELTKDGLAFEKNIDVVKASITNMSDEEFSNFKNILKEATAKFEMMSEEQKKKMIEEEEKKKKDKKDAKASKTDPVEESNIAIANRVEDKDNNKKSAIDAILSQAL